MTPIRQALTPRHCIAWRSRRNVPLTSCERPAAWRRRWTTGANQMIWLQESGTAVKTSPAFADLMTQVDAIQGLQGKVFDVLRRLRTSSS